MRYVQGDTVWLRGTFRGRDGAPYDPADVVCRVYDWQGTQLTGPEGLTPTRVDLGCYEVPYTLPVGQKVITYEFSGVDAEGLSQLSRWTIKPIWA